MWALGNGCQPCLIRCVLSVVADEATSRASVLALVRPRRRAVAITSAVGPDKYYDHHGLILRAIPTGGKQWISRGTIHGKRLDLGLGGWPYVSLSAARQAAFDYRKLARAGGDPLSLRSGQDLPTFA